MKAKQFAVENLASTLKVLLRICGWEAKPDGGGGYHSY